MILRSQTARLVILTLVHFSVDFCGGLTIPLPEPTLTEHLGVNVAAVAALLGGTAILVNVIQPLSGWLLPKRGLPILLMFGPAAAALITCVGLTNSFWGVGAMFGIACIGIGIVHPEGALAAHSVAGQRKGLGISVFMAGGYFGFAFGSLVSGVWVEYHDQGLARFWLLGIPAVIVAVLVYLSGLHRLEAHAEKDEAPSANGLPFVPVLALAMSIAVNMCMLVRFITILLVRSFPGQDAQGWGGATVFATGATGSMGAFLWGYLSDRYGRGRVIFVLQVLCVPFLYMLLHVRSPSAAPLWALGVGATMGGVFPLSVVLARQARGSAHRLRLGLAIGGAWGMGEIAFIIGGRYLARFPDGAAEPVRTVMGACWFFLALTAVLAAVITRAERSCSAAV